MRQGREATVSRDVSRPLRRQKTLGVQDSMPRKAPMNMEQDDPIEPVDEPQPMSTDLASSREAAQPASKRVRDENYVATAAPGGASSRPQLTRQLTPRISWSSLIGDGGTQGSQLSQTSEASAAMDTTTGGDQSQDMHSDGGRQGSCPPPLRRLPTTQDLAPPSPSPINLTPLNLSGRFGTPERPSKWLPPSRAPSIGPMSPLNAEVEADSCGRFDRDFENPKVIGSGCFATVYRAKNRLDNQEYAIKKTKKRLPRGDERRRGMLQEVQTLAAVASQSTSPYVVRYFGAWIEDERLMIQTELCDGTLKDTMVSLRTCRPHDPRFSEEELRCVLRDACMGLAVLHSKELVHLDVKPENILVKHVQLPSPARGKGAATAARIHKIADLGLAVAAMGACCDEINQGDSRYLAREILQGDFKDPKKADVFSLGLTCYELVSNPKELPCNGPEWCALREGALDGARISHLSESMQRLLKWMLRPTPADRPQCSDIIGDPSAAVPPHKIGAQASGGDSMVFDLQKQLAEEASAREAAQARAAAAEEKAERYYMELLDRTRQEFLSTKPVVNNGVGSCESAAQGPAKRRAPKRSNTAP